MTKADIIDGVYERVGFSKKESADLVELIFDTLKVTLENGEKIKISGFGNFQPRYKRLRPGRNPKSGQPIDIPARRVVKFVASQVLKASLNGTTLSPAAHAAALASEQSDLHDAADDDDDGDDE
jgi:integration host factor subunit alpha